MVIRFVGDKITEDQYLIEQATGASTYYSLTEGVKMTVDVEKRCWWRLWMPKYYRIVILYINQW